MRWLLPNLRRGAAAAGLPGTDRAELRPTLTLVRSLETGETEHTFAAGSGERPLQLVGPGDVLGFGPETVLRVEPQAGAADADSSGLAFVEFAAADLPWAASIPATDGSVPPWLALLVCAPGEATLRPADPLPRLQVAAAALFDPATLVTWAHVEVRSDTLPQAADLARLVGIGSRDAAARLLCPRRLAPFTDYLACVVPATAAGRDAGLGLPVTPGAAGRAAWVVGQPAELPVYHSWTFRTGPGGTFEDLARQLRPRPAAGIDGLGARRAVVARDNAGNPSATAPLSGALGVPGQVGRPDAWSDPVQQEAFLASLRRRLAAPDAPDDLPPVDVAVGPPLYAATMAGASEPDQRRWLAELNLEVRHRVAAAAGVKYVQVEQEFLMARAWEQAGDLTAANRSLALAELAAEVATRVQNRHLAGLPAATLTAITGRAPASVETGTPGNQQTVAAALDRSAVPAGAGTPAFLRLTRANGALVRRATGLARRAAVAPPGDSPDVVVRGLAGQQVLAAASRPWAERRAATAITGTLSADARGVRAAGRMAKLLVTQSSQQQLVKPSAAQAMIAGSQRYRELLGTGGAAVLSASWVRGTRAVVAEEPPATDALLAEPSGADVGGAGVIESLVGGLDAGTRQANRMAALLDVDPSATEPGLRPLAWHPVFDLPLATDLLTRWPEWVVPGVTGLPDGTITALAPDPGFVAAFLAGANHEFAREMLWRELPTDRRGTCFTRFWPTDPSGGIGEIADWPGTAALAQLAPSGAAGCALLVRGELLRRFPGTIVAAFPGPVPVPDALWIWPSAVVVDPGTTVFLFPFADPSGHSFVLRQPVASAQFGFDDGAEGERFDTWADLTWRLLGVPVHGFVDPRTSIGPATPEPGLPPRLPSDPALFARIAFQAPFQWVVAGTALQPQGEP